MISFRTLKLLGVALAVLPFGVTSAWSAEGNAFSHDVKPFLAMYCFDCHGGDEPEGGIGFDKYNDSSNIQQDYEVWDKVLRMLVGRQMPPEDALQPDEAQRLSMIDAVRAELATFDCSGASHPGRVTVRRLNRAEYNNTIRDLIGIDYQPANDFPADDVGNGFDNIGAVLTIPPLLLEKYLDAAESIVTRAFADDAAKKRIFAVQPSGEERQQQIDAARQNLERFARRAFRRTPTPAELERLFELVFSTIRAGYSNDEAMQVAIQAILVSPHFIFRVEREADGEPADESFPLSGFEVATRLSYFLWSSMPDDELFELAEMGDLTQPDVLKGQVARMLSDPKSRALVDNFAGQWLQLRDLQHLAPDPKLFPDFDEALRESMRRETEVFFETMVREDRSVVELLNADFTFVNERLARHYGMDGVQGSEFRRVALDDRRRGVLTHASVLLLTSNPTRTSPVKRGKWILDNFLGEPPPPPPAGVEALDEDGEVLGSLRERLEQHRSNASCAVCHERMDPLGFGLENFDAIGAWREMDGRYEIVPSGTLPGGLDFSSPAELMEILSEEKRDEFCRCLTMKLLTYALGRGITSHDRCAVDQMIERLSEDEYRFRALVTAIVQSDPFLLREGKGTE